MRGCRNTPSCRRAKQTLREHSVQLHHKKAAEDAAVFLGQMERGHLSIQQQLQCQAVLAVQRNRSILTFILKTIVFCGRQNIALRGHRGESATHIDDSEHNPGNFQSLLQFRLDAGDEMLREHFSTAGKNAQYTSPSVRNELIAATGQWIQEQLIREVKEAKFFPFVQMKQLMLLTRNNSQSSFALLTPTM